VLSLRPPFSRSRLLTLLTRSQFPVINLTLSVSSPCRPTACPTLNHLPVLLAARSTCSSAMLHENLHLYVSNEAYTLVGDSEKAETLHIDRASNNISIFRQSSSRPRLSHTPAHLDPLPPRAATSTPPAKFDKEHTVFGLFGIVSLLRCEFAVSGVVDRRLTFVYPFASTSRLPRRHYQTQEGRHRPRLARIRRDRFRCLPHRTFEYRRAPRSARRSLPVGPPQEPPLLGAVLLYVWRIQCHDENAGAEDLEWKATLGDGAPLAW
jgi:hypothetical protein